MSRPLCLVIAGPNGAGKTTFAQQFLLRERPGLRFFNVDEVARTLFPWDPDAKAIEAGRLFIQQLAEAARAKLREAPPAWRVERS
ncbi:MAG: AAA family ATPase [Opitutales bacterium]